MKRIEGKRRGGEGAWKNRGGKKRWRGGEARFSFLSASTADKGHCGGSYCGGLTYARVYAYVEPIWMRARAPYRSHPYVSSHEESGLTHAPTVTTYLYICIYMLGRVFQIWYIVFWKILEIFLLFNFDLLNLFLTPTVTIYIYIYLEFCKFSLDIRKNILNRMWKIFYYKFELDCSNMALVLTEFSKFRKGKDSLLFTHPI